MEPKIMSLIMKRRLLNYNFILAYLLSSYLIIYFYKEKNKDLNTWMKKLLKEVLKSLNVSSIIKLSKSLFKMTL